ncbi:MAG: tetratricopeptide repeat protein [Acidobacteria bacterium]|nr:tetratricopeptide repeat protein [Acidobacteriota bacterium]
MNRELLNLEEQVRAAQRSLEEKVDRVLQQAQQATEASNKNNASLAEIEKRVQEQGKTIAQPVAGIGLKVDQMASEFQALKESVSSLNARFGKLEQQIVDIGTALRTLQSPVAPPPPAGGPAAGLSADALFQNAVSDKEGGNADLALRGFRDYVQNYSATYLAPAAQYYIGEILFGKGQWEDAVNAFDVVLEKFPVNDKTPDAHYMKAMALLKLGDSAGAREELSMLIKRFPNNPLSEKARLQLKTVRPAAKSSKGKK